MGLKSVVSQASRVVLEAAKIKRGLSGGVKFYLDFECILGLFCVGLLFSGEVLPPDVFSAAKFELFYFGFFVLFANKQV